MSVQTTRSGKFESVWLRQRRWKWMIWGQAQLMLVPTRPASHRPCQPCRLGLRTCRLSWRGSPGECRARAPQAAASQLHRYYRCESTDLVMSYLPHLFAGQGTLSSPPDGYCWVVAGLKDVKPHEFWCWRGGAVLPAVSPLSGAVDGAL